MNIIRYHPFSKLLTDSSSVFTESVTCEVAGRWNCVQQSQALQNVASVDDFWNVAAIETVALFEYLEFEFLLEYDVFAPCDWGANTSS